MSEPNTTIPLWVEIIFGISSVLSLAITFFNYLILRNITRKIKDKKAQKILIDSIENYKLRLKQGGEIPSDYLRRINDTIQHLKKYDSKIFHRKLTRLIENFEKYRSITEQNVDNIIEILDLIKIEIEEVL